MKSENLFCRFEGLPNVLEKEKQVHFIGWGFFHAEFKVKGAGFLVFGVDKFIWFLRTKRVLNFLKNKLAPFARQA